MKYRAEIDGLRALAVLPVIFFHAGFESFSGGFVGVDVFFVISGYLITTIIINEIDTGQFSLVNFYERRARRILPALFFVILVCLPFAWAWLMPRDLKDFAQSILGVATFTSNIFFYLKSGYFDTAVELKPLIHTWSLAIEEQFYVFFPLLLLLIARWGRNTTMAVMCIIFAASLLACFWAAYYAPSAGFYLLLFRAWELLLGAFAAILLIDARKPFLPRFANHLSVAGLILIALPIAVYNESTPFPGFAALVPTIGAMLVILFASPGTIAARVLSMPILVKVGLISYSAYLWHQPIFAFARHRSLSEPSPILYLALSALALMLAYASWKFVETPFRNRQRMPRMTIFALAGAASFGMLIVGGIGHKQNGFPNRFSDDLRAIAESGETPTVAAACLFDEVITEPNSKDLQRCYKPGKTVYLLGDSHARSIADAINEAVSKEGYQFFGFIKEGCMPLRGVTRDPRHRSCPQFNEDVAAFVDNHPGIVVLSARWRLNLEGDPYNNGEGGIEYDKWGPNYIIGDEKGNIFSFAQRQFAALADKQPLVIVDQIPEAGWNVPEQMLRLRRYDSKTTAPLSTSYDVYKHENERVISMFDGLHVSSRARIIKTASLVCSDRTGRCLNESDGAPLYYDDDHPSQKFAKIIAENVVETIKDFNASN